MLQDWILFTERYPEVNEAVLVCARGFLFTVLHWPKCLDKNRFIDLVGPGTNYNSDIYELDAWIPLEKLMKYIPNESINYESTKYVTVPYEMLVDLHSYLNDFIENDIRRHKLSHKDKNMALKNAHEISKKLLHVNTID